ncbi:MAG: guanylate kinase [Candidatus Omnitrophica bacterium]|nr:guanylate kinase [Candidatus Omnitrophota bacterium]
MKLSKIFIISGPSGAGKTTLLKKLFLRKFIKNNFIRTVSFITRKKRRGEKEGSDYFFVSREKFLKLKEKKFFLEYQNILGDYYGTPKYFLTKAKKLGKNLILCIDVKGGMYLRKILKNNKLVNIFISVPDKNVLYERLKKRAENKEIIKKRINLAKKELQFIKKYDYLIINENLKDSLKFLEAILIAESIRRE